MITELELELAICNRLEALLPDLYKDGYRLESRQALLETNRLDIVLKHPDGKYLILELKKGNPPVEVIKQLSRYVRFWRQSYPDQQVNGMVIGNKLTKLRMEEIEAAGYSSLAINEELVLKALLDGVDCSTIPAGKKFTKADATGKIRFLLSDFDKITLPFGLELTPPWTQEKVFHALVKRGLRHKDLWKNNIYVALYPQVRNCAILYHPDCAKAVNAAPLHFNNTQVGWDSKFFDRLEPHLKYQWRDTKKTAFDWYAAKGDTSVEQQVSWDRIAEVLELPDGDIL